MRRLSGKQAIKIEKLVREAQEQKPSDLGENVGQLQKWMDNGTIWRLEGSVGRTAMEMLEKGVLFLPVNTTTDFYGNVIPSRNQLVPGTKGTLELAAKHWLGQ